MTQFLRVPVTAAPGPSGLATWIRAAANTINQAAAITETGVEDGDKGDITVSDTGATWEFDSSVVTAFARTFLDDTTAGGVRSTIGAQADDATLTALAGLNSTAGLLEQTGADTFTKRAMGVASSTDVLTRADGDGRYSLTSHNHTGVYQPADVQLDSLAALTYTGNAAKVVAVKADESGFELISGGAGGTTTNALTMNNGGAGAASGTTFDGSVARTISYNTIGAQPSDATLTALAAYNTNGLIAQTAADTFAGRTLTGPAAGISVANGDGVSGNPTLSLANDLAALEALSGTNTIYYRSAADTWTAVTIGSRLAFSGGSLNTAFSGARLKKTTSLTGLNFSGAGANVLWDAEFYDTDSYHDTSSNTDRITITNAGYYEFAAMVALNNLTSANYARLLIQHYDSSNVLQSNVGGNSIEISSTASTWMVGGASGPVLAASGDYFVVFMICEDSSVDIGTAASFFSSRRVG